MKNKTHSRAFLLLVVLITGFAFVATPVFAQGGFEGHEQAPVREFEPDEDGIIKIDVTNEGYQFLPTKIRVPAGSEVHLTFTSVGQHDWILEGYDVGTSVLRNGQSETVVFTADMTGEFEFYCSVANHRRMGMFGTLFVD